MDTSQVRTYSDDSFDVRFSGVLDDGFQAGNLVLNLQYLFELLAVLDHNDVGLTVEGAVQASLGRVGRVNAGSKASACSEIIKIQVAIVSSSHHPLTQHEWRPNRQ